MVLAFFRVWHTYFSAKMLPNYKDGSIVNLVSSIIKALGGRPVYGQLKLLPASQLKCKNVVLIVMDGLGYEYVKRNGKGTIFEKYLLGPITSVFPATTAAAVTSFFTGVAPQQHAITGWHMHLKELGVVSAIMRFIPRSGGVAFSKLNIPPRKVFDQKTIYEKIRAKSFNVILRELGETDYNKVYSRGAKVVYYENMAGFFGSLSRIILKEKGRKLIYGYWPEPDLLQHYFGTRSKESYRHFKLLDRKLGLFLKLIRNTDTTVIITGDHGLIDVPKSRSIQLRDHPKLADTLTLPICGEARLGYCYVHPSKKRQFEHYMSTRMKKYFSFHKSEELIKKNYFGLGKPNPNLFDRVGDYTVIPKNNYALLDALLAEKRHSKKARHGGTSKEEMLVPLIVIKA